MVVVDVLLQLLLFVLLSLCVEAVDREGDGVWLCALLLENDGKSCDPMDVREGDLLKTEVDDEGIG
jgi:hypothetical protein